MENINNRNIPTWTLIICCFNSEERLGSTLSYVKKLKNINEIELLIVDNNSSDQTVEYLTKQDFNEFKNFKIIRENRQGLAYARVAGLKAATGEFICFVDDDNWLSIYYLERATKIFQENPKVGIIGGSSCLPSDYIVPVWLQFYLRAYAVGTQHNTFGLLPPGSFVWGAGLCIRRHAWNILENIGFNPILIGRVGTKQLSADDGELVHSIALLGFRIWYDPNLILVHAIDKKRLFLKKLLMVFYGFGKVYPLYKYYIEAAANSINPKSHCNNEIDTKVIKNINKINRILQRLIALPISQWLPIILVGIICSISFYAGIISAEFSYSKELKGRVRNQTKYIYEYYDFK